MKRILLFILILMLAACSGAAPASEGPDPVAEAVELTLAAVQEAEVVEAVQEAQDCDCSVLTKLDPSNENLADVYILDNATGQENFFATLEDIATGQNSAEYHHGNVYVIKEIGYDAGIDDQDWTHQLWKYDANGNGTMLFDNKGISFRVSPDENYLAISYLPTGAELQGGEMLAFYDFQGNLLHEFASAEFRVEQAMLSLEAWSDDSSVLWLNLRHAGPRPQAFVRINVAAWQPDIYIFADTPVGAEYDLNANAGKLVYSDHPVFFDVNSALEFENGINPVTLFVYDFSSQGEQVIASCVSKLFNPQWVDDHTVEYDDPAGDGRLLVTVN